MKDLGLYINDHVRTGELVDAGKRLGYYGLKVSDWAYDRTAKLPQNANTEAVRRQLHPLWLDQNMLQGWQIAENTAARLLIASRTMAYPRDAVSDANNDLRREDAIPFKPASERDIVSGFYARRLIKLEVLQEGEILQTLGSTTWTALVYEECALVRGAIANGLYYEGSWE